METVEVYFPLFVEGWPVYELPLDVYPVEDQRAADAVSKHFGMSIDVRFTDRDGNQHRINDDEQVLAILKNIKAHDPDKWQAIERAARANYAPDLEDVA